MSTIGAIVSRVDSWVNAMTGLGTLRDKLTHARAVPGVKLTDGALESLFNDDDVARRMVVKLPQDALRRGYRVCLDADDEATPDIERALTDQMLALGANAKLREGWIWARLYGGHSGIFIGADDGQRPEQPLDETRIRSIRFLNVVRGPNVSVLTRYSDIAAPNYGKPEIYTVSSALHGGQAIGPALSVRVHESRLLLFDGAMSANTQSINPNGRDDSLLQAAYAVLQQTATAWQSVAHLMTDASQGVLKVANLMDLIASRSEEALKTRIAMMDMARSVCRAILVDAERESFERVATSFAGLPEVMDKLMMRVSAASEGMPVTLLYGRSPAGLNATGESDIRGWYDTVAAAQTDELQPRLHRLLTLMFLAKDSPTRGVVPEQWEIEFNPLWEPTDKELADTKKVKADTYVALVGAQIVTEAEAAIGLAPDFPTIDVKAREEMEEAQLERLANPPDPMDPEGGGGPAGGGGPEGGAPEDPRDDSWQAQTRAPKGSSTGGQWVSSGGGGKAKGAAKGGAKLTEGERQAIRAGVKSGAIDAAFTQKLMQRYGATSAKQAGILWERDIKAQLKAAKAQRAQKALGEAEHKALMKTAGTRAADAAALHARSALEAGHILAHAQGVADKAAAKAIGEAEHKAKQTHEGKRWGEQETAALNEKAAILKHAAVVELAAEAKVQKPTKKKTAKPKKTIAELKAELEAKQQKTAELKTKVAEKKKSAAKLKAEVDALMASQAQLVAAKAVQPKAAAKAKKKNLTQAEAIAESSLEAWEKQQQAKWAQTSAAPKKKAKAAEPTYETVPFYGPDTAKLAGNLLKAGTAEHVSKHASAAGLASSVRGPLHMAPSPHAAKFEQMANQQSTSFKVVEGAVGKAHAEEGHLWKQKWVGSSTDTAAQEVLDHIDNPNHHVHAQYHATQALLRKHLPELQQRGIVDKDGYVTVYRGVKHWGQGEALEKALKASPDGSTDLQVRGASSWSASHEVSRSFAGSHGTVVQQRVHYSNALVVHNFEPKWTLREIEWTLVSRDEKFSVVRADESIKDPY